MKRSPPFLAIRAIATEFAARIYRPVVWIASISLVVVLGVLIWLTTLSGWWWVALVPVIFAALLFAILATIAGVLISLLKPQQNKEQRTKVKAFVDAIQGSSEALSTPKFIVLFRLVKDTITPSEKGFVRELSSNASTLRTGFQEIIASFRG
jgi:hypothetical protein